MQMDWTEIGRRLRPSRVAHAHCDIPCGIYDPHAAEIAAQTVEKMVSLIADLGPDDDTTGWHNSFSRYVTVKEQHAELLKREVLIIWATTSSRRTSRSSPRSTRPSGTWSSSRARTR